MAKLSNDEKIEKLKKLSTMMEGCFDWGCTDGAWDAYAHAVYSIITEDPCFQDSVENFIEEVTMR